MYAPAARRRPRLAVPARRRWRRRGRPAVRAAVPARGAARPRGARPGSEPDGADGRGADGRPGDDRGDRRGRWPCARGRGRRVARRGDPRRRAPHLDPAGRPGRGGRGRAQRELDGVGRVSPIATFEVASQGVRTDAAAVVGKDLLDDGRLRFVAGDRAAALSGARRGRVGRSCRGRSPTRLPLGVGSVCSRHADGTRMLDAARRRDRRADAARAGRRDHPRRLGRRDRDTRRRRRRRASRSATSPGEAAAAGPLVAETRPVLRPRADAARRVSPGPSTRARTGLRPVRRAGDHRRHRRRARHRQHADDERPRARPRDRRAPCGRDDPPPGAADRRRRGRHPGARRGRSWGSSPGSWPAHDGRPRPAATLALGHRVPWSSIGAVRRCSAWACRCSRRGIRPVSRAVSRSSGPSSTSSPGARLGTPGGLASRAAERHRREPHIG